MSFDTRALIRFGMALVFAFAIDERADAAGRIDRRPGTFCKPIDSAMAQHVLYNSGGAIANMSTTDSMWVVCPLRTSGEREIVVRVATTLLIEDPVPCSVRLTTGNGEVTWTFPADNSVQTANDGPIYSASMRCELPPSGAHGPQGIISVTTSTMPLFQACIGENGCEGTSWCEFDGRCRECECW